MKALLVLIGVCLLLGCSKTKDFDQNQHWQLIYKNDAEGKALFGEKKDLLNAVRNGYPIRIGWGMRSRIDSTVTIEHVAEAKFLSIINGEEVFAQIDRIIGQRPEVKPDSIKIHFREQNQWVKMAGSNGFSTAIMYDYVNDSLVNFGRSNTSATSWFVRYDKKIDTAQVLYKN